MRKAVTIEILNNQINFILKQRKKYKKISIHNINKNEVAIKRFIKSNRLLKTKTNIILSSNEILLRRIEVNKMKDKDIKAFIFTNIESYISTNTDEYEYIYKKDNEFIKDGVVYLGIILFAIPKSIFYQIDKLISLFNIKINKIDIYSNILHEMAKEKETDIAIVDINSDRLDFMSFRKGNFFMYTNVEYETFDKEEESIEYDKLEKEALKNIENYSNYFSDNHFGDDLKNIYIMSSTLPSELLRNLYEKIGPFKSSIKESSKHTKVDINRLETFFISNKKDSLDLKKIIFRDLRKKKIKAIKNLFVFIFALTTIFYIFLTPYVENYKIKEEHLSLLETDETYKKQVELSYLKDEIVTKINSREELLEKVNQINLDYIKLYEIMERSAPLNVKIETFSIETDMVLFIAYEINNSQNVVDLIISLKNLNLFEDIPLSSVNLKNEKERVTFTLKLKEDKVKNILLNKEWRKIYE